MEYIAEHPEERTDYEGALFALMAISAPLDDREAIEAASEDWWIEVGPVDLGADIVTIQQNTDLIAAICSRPDGTLRTALFRPPDAKVVEYLLSLAANPGPNGLVNMRENNWELALDASAGMGNAYANQAGQAYLSRWEYGLGVTALGEVVSTWYDQRSITPIPNALVVGVVGTYYSLKDWAVLDDIDASDERGNDTGDRAMKSMWMVRAGRNAKYLDDFKEKNLVAIGWIRMGDLSAFKSQESMRAEVKAQWPEWKAGKLAMSVSQIWRFAHEIKEGDTILTYDPQRRVYLYGDATGGYRYDPSLVEDNPHSRGVVWRHEVERDVLSTTAKNSLGAISTLFRIPAEVAQEINAIAAGETPPAKDVIDEEVEQDELTEDIEEKALEFIKDRISKLEWDEMQELIAGLLRAMGYKTKVSPAGPDRGKDIVASPDGFGFENPRIVVEVKHRSGTMGSTAIRSFLGGRHKDDKGLFVSTGGFSKDAYYEAERANIPVTLMTLDDVVKEVVNNYDRIDIETQRLVPLKRIYWPI